jgi:hypothetical protein
VVCTSACRGNKSRFIGGIELIERGSVVPRSFNASGIRLIGGA